MIELFGYSVQQPSVESQQVMWTVKPTTEDISLYNFTILRSNSPEGPFDVIANIKNTFHYDDFSINQKSEYRTFYYKVRVVSPDGSCFVDYGPFYNSSAPDALALELIRKKNVALNFGSTPSVPISIFIRKTWGTYCTQCFDSVKKRRFLSNCSSCYNTNYVGGFFSPIIGRAFFGPSDKAIQQVGFELHPDKIFIEIANYPIMSPGDIIKQENVARYRVTSMRSTRRGAYVISQFLQMDKVDFGDIEYGL